MVVHAVNLPYPLRYRGCAQLPNGNGESWRSPALAASTVGAVSFAGVASLNVPGGPDGQLLVGGQLTAGRPGHGQPRSVPAQLSSGTLPLLPQPLPSFWGLSLPKENSPLSSGWFSSPPVWSCCGGSGSARLEPEPYSSGGQRLIGASGSWGLKRFCLTRSGRRKSTGSGSDPEWVP